MTTHYILGSSRWPTFLVVLILLLSSFCQAGTANVTIDDSYGDSTTGFKPVYSPKEGAWADQTCQDCAIKPDRSKAYNGTWNAVTYTTKLKGVSITLEFTGVALWVFFILANANKKGDKITTNTGCTFTLDGSLEGNFTHSPDMNDFELVYDVPVFSITGLSNSHHRLIISPSDPHHQTYINFDYAIYTVMTGENMASSVPGTSAAAGSTSVSGPLVPSQKLTHSSSSGSMTILHLASSSSTFPTSTPSTNLSHGENTSHQSTTTGAIVGAVLGVVATIIFILLLLLRCSSKSQSRPITKSLGPEPVGELQRESHRSNPFGTRSSSPSNSHARLTSGLHPLARIRRTQFRGEKLQAKLREERQREIERRLQSARLEMETLTSENGTAPPFGTSEISQEMVETLREQVDILKSRIESLEQAKQSNWAMGLSDKEIPLA